MANANYRVLTEKGLRYIVQEVKDNSEAVLAAKAELHRRGLKVSGLRHNHRDTQYLPRDYDGYEKDH